MSRVTRDGTAEPVSRDQIFRRVRDRGIFIFPVQLTTRRIGNLTRLIHTLYVMAIHTCIHVFGFAWLVQAHAFVKIQDSTAVCVTTVLYCTVVPGILKRDLVHHQDL